MQKEFTAFFRSYMEQKLASRPDLLKTIIPDFAPGCRRLTPGKGFLEALIEPNVEVISDRIKEVTETGVVLESGQTIDLDALVCATGFRVSEAPNFPVVGRNGLTLAQRWAKRPEKLPLHGGRWISQLPDDVRAQQRNRLRQPDQNP